MKEKKLKEINYEYLSIRVNGAGKFIISYSDNWTCGGEKGFSVGASWGKYGYFGGTMPKEEARKLANHILDILND